MMCNYSTKSSANRTRFLNILGYPTGYSQHSEKPNMQYLAHKST